MDISYLKQKRILLVDDEPELLDMVASILKEYDFENIQTAQTAKGEDEDKLEGLGLGADKKTVTPAALATQTALEQAGKLSDFGNI